MIAEKLKQVTHIPKEYLVENPPIPKSIKIELTSKCNYNCIYCSISDRKNKPKDMTWDLFVTISNEIKYYGIHDVGLFFVGESFLNPNFLIKCIAYLKKALKIPYVFLTSNASMAAPEIVKKCMEAGLDSLKWSCNAYNEEQFFDLMRIDPIMFRLANRNIKMAFEIRNKNKYETKLYASSIRYNDGQVLNMGHYLETEVLPYVDEHYWLPLYSMGGQSINRELKSGYKPIAGNSGNYADPVDPIPCWSLFTAAHVLSDGRMTACCADGIGNWVVGDLTKQSFLDCWHSDEFQKLRKSHLENKIEGTKCEKCALIN